jgi:hypothetical protein
MKTITNYAVRVTYLEPFLSTTTLYPKDQPNLFVKTIAKKQFQQNIMVCLSSASLSKLKTQIADSPV